MAKTLPQGDESFGKDIQCRSGEGIALASLTLILEGQRGYSVCSLSFAEGEKQAAAGGPPGNGILITVYPNLFGFGDTNVK
jgi:hypothetical protein